MFDTQAPRRVAKAKAKAYCIAFGCLNNNMDRKLTFFTLPKDIERRRKWLKLVDRGDLLPRGDLKRSSHLVCSAHFEDSSIKILKHLKENALPSLLLHNHNREGSSCSKASSTSARGNFIDKRLDDDDANSGAEDMPGTSSQKSLGNEVKVFCPKCNTEVPHAAEGIQEDQTKILVAKVYHYFEQEYEELKKMYGDVDLTPLSRFRQRTALATGVSETMVLQILDEEQGRNAVKRQEPPQKRRLASKRSRQMDNSSEEESSDDNVDDGGPASVAQLTRKEPEIETLVVKIEPAEHCEEQPQTDPILVEVKAEPPDEEVNNSKIETLALNEPAGTKRKGRKIPRRSDVTSAQQHTQGGSSTTAAASNVRVTEQLHESGLLGATEVKLENIVIEEEGFS